MTKQIIETNKGTRIFFVPLCFPEVSDIKEKSKELKRIEKIKLKNKEK